MMCNEVPPTNRHQSSRLVRRLPSVVLCSCLLSLVGTQAASAASVPQTKNLARLTCRASMSVAHPVARSKDDVLVTTVPNASVTTVAHYKTTNTTRHGVANSAGKAVVVYSVGRPTPGVKVVVNVTVKKGARSGSCSTSFTPA